MPTQRQLRVNSLLREEIAIILQRDIQDPRIGFATVTDVEVSADLRHANVFVSVFGTEEEKEETMAGLADARQYIQNLIGDRIVLKYLPRLAFHLDETANRAQRMEEILRNIDTGTEDSDDEPDAPEQ